MLIRAGSNKKQNISFSHVCALFVGVAKSEIVTVVRHGMTEKRMKCLDCDTNNIIVLVTSER